MTQANPAAERRTIAYFSMEAGLHPDIPTYSGGLGVLSGDTLRAAADLGVPMVGISLIYHKGHFRQHLDAHGNQSETPREWRPSDYMDPLDVRVSVSIEGRDVCLTAWQYTVHGVRGHTIPVYLLDSNLPVNDVADRTLTDSLYGGDSRYRLCQEIILGLGGLAMLDALGYHEIETHHMNEGHSALLALGLLEREMAAHGGSDQTEEDVAAVRSRCVFTTHTPIAAGHDRFPLPLARHVVGEKRMDLIDGLPCTADDTLNMTYLGLQFSRYVNGVSMRHGEVAQEMYPDYTVNAITNGVDAATWASPPFQDLFDEWVPRWRDDNLYLRQATVIPARQIAAAHVKAKAELLDEVARRTGIMLDRNAFTIGFARRATGYKRADLLFTDIGALKSIAREAGPLQIIYAGKAHPRDDAGKALIRRVFEGAAKVKDTIKVVYLEEHDMTLGRLLCSGVDLWLNTPQLPLEASGTSGMKAALNGVPSLSVVDGWWVEGWVEGTTGWAIGAEGIEDADAPDGEARSLYNKLAYVILPLYYGRPGAFAELQRQTIALNGSYFNAQRMMLQYVENAYRPREAIG
jgi:starch phosphorylase